jgi:biofilm PGA synthesis protein PgaA
VDSTLLGVDGRYRAHESLAVYAGLRYQDFSDGNRRVAVFTDGRWRQRNGPRYKLDVTGSLYASRNSREDAAYFNPERDFEALFGLDNQWRMFRRYARSLVHRLHARAGIYDQASFGGNLVWSLDYEFAWSLSDALELRMGWTRARRVYDGSPEYQTFWRAGLDGRF